MNTHSIRLKSPWLVTPAGTEVPTSAKPQGRGLNAELTDQICQLVGASNQPLDVWAIRRFHRPTGLSAKSELKIVIVTTNQPDLVSWIPLAPGDQGACSPPTPLTRNQASGNQTSGNRAEYQLPSELPLRSELRLAWSQLTLDSAPRELTVELAIYDPA